jgi:electron transport complex protein RnfA
LLQRVLGLYIPLVATNCAVLGVALINTAASRSFVAALFYGAGAAAGFALALVLFAALRERLAYADVPVAFRGAAITFVTAGLLSLAFMAFTGFARL